MTDIETVGIATPNSHELFEQARKVIETLRLHSRLIERLVDAWRPEHRHNLALWVSGALRKTGVGKTEAKIIVKTICLLADDQELDDRLRAVEDTYRKSIEEVKAWSGLRQELVTLIGEEAAEKLLHLFQATKDKSGGNEGKKELHVLSRVKPLMMEAIAFQNIVGEYDDRLLIYENGSFSVVEQLELNGFVFKPRPRKSYPYEPYAFSDGPAPYRLELIERVYREVDTFVDAEPEVKAVFTAFVILSYVQEKFDCIPYLYLVGDNESGKSHTLNLFTWLCYRPFSGVSHTAADLYSYLEDDGLPLTIIEDEFQGSEEDNDKMKIYKSGYKRGARVGRVVTYEGGRRIDYFNTYGMKIMAGERLIENKGLLQRCIIVELVEGYPVKDHYDESDYFRFRALRNDLLKWRMKVLAGDEHLEQPVTELKGRARELYTPLLAVLKGHEFYEKVIEWIKKLEQQKMAEKQLSVEGLLAKILLDSVRKGENELALDKIWQALLQFADVVTTPNKPDTMYIPHIGSVTKKLLGRRLREVFAASRRYTRLEGRQSVVYCFDACKVTRLARKYGLDPQISTQLSL